MEISRLANSRPAVYNESVDKRSLAMTIAPVESIATPGESFGVVGVLTRATCPSVRI
jgi:hypothetical protein